MSRFKIDDRTRALMLKHLAESDLRISEPFTEEGKQKYPLLLQMAFANYDEDWLADQFVAYIRRPCSGTEAELRAKARALATEAFEIFMIIATVERMIEDGEIPFPPVERSDIFKFDPVRDDLSSFLEVLNPPQPYRMWVIHWCEVLAACQRMGGDIYSLRIEKPASPEDVEKVENQLGRKLPSSLRKTFLEFSAGFEFEWRLPQESSSPFGIYSGGTGIELAWLARLEEDREGWIRHVFADPTHPYDSIWYNKLAIISVVNGDMIGIDLASADGCVVYLSHDGDEDLHGMILGKNFADFMGHWSKLGCVGPQGWELEHFIVEGAYGINSLSANASIWRKWLGLE